MKPIYYAAFSPTNDIFEFINYENQFLEICRIVDVVDVLLMSNFRTIYKWMTAVYSLPCVYCAEIAFSNVLSINKCANCFRLWFKMSIIISELLLYGQFYERERTRSYWPIEHVSTFSSLFDRVYKSGARFSFSFDIFQNWRDIVRVRTWVCFFFVSGGENVVLLHGIQMVSHDGHEKCDA